MSCCALRSGRFVGRDNVQVDGTDPRSGVIAQSMCVPTWRQTVPNRCVVCRSRRLRTPVDCGPRDPNATSIAFQRIPGHDPGGRLRCTSGLPTAGLRHGASVWSVILMLLLVAMCNRCNCVFNSSSFFFKSVQYLESLNKKRNTKWLYFR